jgi:hypothetical protein
MGNARIVEGLTVISHMVSQWYRVGKAGMGMKISILIDPFQKFHLPSVSQAASHHNICGVHCTAVLLENRRILVLYRLYDESTRSECVLVFYFTRVRSAERTHVPTTTV